MASVTMMDAHEINYRLKRAGLSQAHIARDLGVSQSVVGNVIHNRITAWEVARHIAGVLGEEVCALWPDRYTFKPRGRSAQRKSAAPTSSSSSKCASGEGGGT